MKRLAAGLSGAERRLVLGVCVISAAAMVSSATFNYAVTPMVQDLDATESQQSLLRQLPNIGALLVIFLAGVLGLRVGARRFLIWCGALMAVGYGLTMVAPIMPVASAGLLLGSIGRQGLFVVVISLLSSRLASDESRATGFASFAAVSPAVYFVAPTLAGALVGVVGWRAIVLLWVLSACAALLASARMLPKDEPAAESGPAGAGQGTGELWTPALAGFVLAALVQTFNNVGANGWGSPRAWVWFALAGVSMAVLVLLMRRLAHPTLDLSILKHGGIRLMLLVVVLIPFTNLWYYMTVGLQYVYGYTAFESAVIMMPSQVAGMAGAAMASGIIKRRGLRFAGTVTLLSASAALFLCTTQTVTMPLWIPVLVLCLYSASLTAAGIPLTNSIMNLAPRGKEGSAASFRGASSSLGAALGVVLMSGIVYGTFETSLTNQLTAAGQDASQVGEVSAALRSGSSSEEVSAQYSVPLDTVDDIDAEQKQAMVDGYRAQGLAGGLITLAAAGVFYFNRRGLRSPDADAQAAAVAA